jgi:hypothetical protein
MIAVAVDHRLGYQPITQRSAVALAFSPLVAHILAERWQGIIGICKEAACGHVAKGHLVHVVVAPNGSGWCHKSSLRDANAGASDRRPVAAVIAEAGPNAGQLAAR